MAADATRGPPYRLSASICVHPRQVWSENKVATRQSSAVGYATLRAERETKCEQEGDRCDAEANVRARHTALLGCGAGGQGTTDHHGGYREQVTLMWGVAGMQRAPWGRTWLSTIVGLALWGTTAAATEVQFVYVGPTTGTV